MDNLKNFSDIRRDYGSLSLNEEVVLDDPIAQFELWFAEVLEKEQHDPTAMVLSTVDEQGHPDSRVVLLKGISEDHFLFYTNYQSMKGRQLQSEPYAALNFHWPVMARQVRIRGPVKKLSAKESDSYFASRPFKSQLSAIVSPQSQEIRDRRVLEEALNELEQSHTTIARPKHWGGYKLAPEQIEFWQGRDNRLHDRIQYIKEATKWLKHRLAP